MEKAVCRLNGSSGRHAGIQWEDKVVALLEARDGTILDTVRKIKPVEPA